MAELHDPRCLLLTADARLVNNGTENEQQGTGATRKSRRDARICCPIACGIESVVAWIWICNGRGFCEQCTIPANKRSTGEERRWSWDGERSG